MLLELYESHPKYSKTEKVRVEVLRRFGYYCTESNGHLSEYLPWYRKRTKEIPEWIDLSSWIDGETGGYLRICTEAGIGLKPCVASRRGSRSGCGASNASLGRDAG